MIDVSRVLQGSLHVLEYLRSRLTKNNNKKNSTQKKIIKSSEREKSKKKERKRLMILSVINILFWKLEVREIHVVSIQHIQLVAYVRFHLATRKNKNPSYLPNKILFSFLYIHTGSKDPIRSSRLPSTRSNPYAR